MKYKSIVLDVLIFLSFVSFAVFIFFFQVESLTPQQKQAKFISEKLKIVSGKVDSEKPLVQEVGNLSEYELLDFSSDLEVGDFIFIYEEGRFAFFVDKDTERIKGVGEF